MRKPNPTLLPQAGNCHVTIGDLCVAESIQQWLEPGSTVVHLAYMFDEGAEANLNAVSILCKACSLAKVRRVVHVSTAEVVGRAPGDWVDENTFCEPVSEYGRAKLAIEATLREASVRYQFDLVILRPSHIFGPAGLALASLVGDLRSAHWTKNYCRSVLFGRRAMNLVHVENVVAAIRFLIDYPQDLGGQVLLLSEDEDSMNNFSNVQSAIFDYFDLKPFPFNVRRLPDSLLSALLRLRGRDSVNPRRRFSSSRIESLGFRKPIEFTEGLHDYLAWYKQAMLVKSPG